jgi:uncharacterized membrane protein
VVILYTMQLLDHEVLMKNQYRWRLALTYLIMISVAIGLSYLLGRILLKLPLWLVLILTTLEVLALTIGGIVGIWLVRNKQIKGSK